MEKLAAIGKLEIRHTCTLGKELSVVHMVYGTEPIN
jgi:hypothetical protein